MSGVRDRWREVRGSLSPPSAKLIEREIGDAASVLDVGCGADSPLASFGGKYELTVGVDAHEPALARSRAAGKHDEYVLLDVRRIAERFQPGSFDAVIAIDVLEHMDEAEGLDLLESMERIARRRVVVFTPNGFVQQGETNGSPWQAHRSGWSTGCLRELGFRVYGVHGVRGLRGELSEPRWRPRRAWKLVSDLTQPVALRLPALAFQLLCVKEIRHSGPVSLGERARIAAL